MEESRPDTPVKSILMSSVSVNHPGAPDARSGTLEKGFLWILRGVLPPSRDNQRAADFLPGERGAGDPFVQWVAVRPDSLREGDVSQYSLHEVLVSSLFRPDSTSMANVAHFMCDLTTDPQTWNGWVEKLPVIVNASGPDD